jgi:hypothetical protein
VFPDTASSLWRIPTGLAISKLIVAILMAEIVLTTTQAGLRPRDREEKIQTTAMCLLTEAGTQLAIEHPKRGVDHRYCEHERSHGRSQIALHENR